LIIIDSILKLYDIIELYLVFSLNKFIYSGVLFGIVQLLFVRRLIIRKNPTTLLLILAFIFIYLNYVLPWQDHPFFNIIPGVVEYGGN